MSKKNTPQSKTRRSRLPQNAPDLNFSPENNFELTGISPQQNRPPIRFRPQSFDYQSQLPQPNQNQNAFYLNRPFVPPQRSYHDYRQEPSGSGYHPNMDFIYPSQPYQPYSPIRSTNLDMNLEDWMPEYPTQNYPSQNYPSQDASMGQGSGHGSHHGSFHGSIPVDDSDDEKTASAEEMSPIKPKQASRRASKAKDKGKKPETSKGKNKKPADPWTKEEEVVLCKAWVYVSENAVRGNAQNRFKFWEQVIEYFNKETPKDRTYDSITTKWKSRIRNRVGNYCAIMENIKNTHGSGENDIDDTSKALKEYRMTYGHDFTLEECYEVLKSHAAWKEVELQALSTNSRKKTKGSSTTSGSTAARDPFDVYDVDDSAEEATRESRSVGRDKGRKKASSSSRDGDVPSDSFMQSLAKNFLRTKKPSKEDKDKNKQGLEDTWLRLREKELEIKQAKLELMRTSKRESDIIFYNTPIDPNLTGRQLEELEKVKAAIKERYNLDY